MSWQGEISTMVRHVVNDLDPTNFKYSVKRLETTILVAAQLVTFDVDFDNPYSINVEQCGLTPDPTDAPKDNAFINMVALKTCCIIVGSEVRTEAANSISIKDGPSAIDLRGVSVTLQALYKDLCAKYDQLVYDYVAGGSLAGQAVLGPYSPGSDFVTRTHNDYNTRGNYFRH
jgi:hypothetical protein